MGDVFGEGCCLGYHTKVSGQGPGGLKSSHGELPKPYMYKAATAQKEHLLISTG